jgi:recombination protein RecR
MVKYPESIDSLVTSFSKLPGVGNKTALRQSLNILNWDKDDVMMFAQSLKDLTEIKFCKFCGIFSDDDVCQICSSEKRKEQKTICVIENISDLMAIENSNQFQGVYHILGGVLNPLLGVGPDQIRLNELKERVIGDGIESVILAINPSVEGDATCSYIRNIIENESVNIERIGFGMPMGGSLEYLDPLTISKALENRKRV